ncbi:MAG TPA: Holliday junction branch migration protein RuvA [Patescibacteria group bacterium]|nr:Holliday junction branch migration protein RuvA [Patescibacteria group bacterium]
MISYLSGKIVASRTGFIVIETGGVGYGVNVDSSVVKKNGEKYELFIHEHIREDCHDLYGFPTFEELELFEKLISVNGVGPKAGLNIMSAGKPDKIVSAIVSDNLGFFTAISGIGKKVAAKIILDLKSKLSGDRNINVLSGDVEGEDLVDSLLQLGYRKVEISAVITKMPENVTGLEARVRWCLKNLAK